MSAVQRGREPVGKKAPALSPLGALNAHIARASGQARAELSANAAHHGGPWPELRSAVRFRETWSRISAEEEVTQAVDRAPDNAGPLNSHMLVLRTLGLMRELSPDYLRRFMAHAEALLWLDQAGLKAKVPAGKAKVDRQKSAGKG
jgi:hypothetical protein